MGITYPENIVLQIAFFNRKSIGTIKTVRKTIFEAKFKARWFSVSAVSTIAFLV
jgi:hypothetical protein